MKKEKAKPTGEKTRYQQIIDGEIEPVGSEKGYLNLKPIPINTRPIEEQKEICRKGAQAVNLIRGKEKTAKESLDRMLSILATDEILQSADIETALAERLKRDNPDMTIYDVINASAIGRAIAGNVASIQYIRDTRGDAPKKEISIDGSITTDADRDLLKSINDRLATAEKMIIVETQSE